MTREEIRREIEEIIMNNMWAELYSDEGDTDDVNYDFRGVDHTSHRILSLFDRAFADETGLTKPE